MNNKIEPFINYLLDSETTSEIAFIENIHPNNELFQSRYLKDWELVVSRKLQQVHQNIIPSALHHAENGQKSDSDAIEEKSTITSSPSSSDDDDEEETENKDQKPVQHEHIRHSDKITYTYTDAVRQCQRLLRLLHFGQQHFAHFTELYFYALEQYIKSDNGKIIDVVYEQIASHIFEGPKDDNERQRLVTYLPSSTNTTFSPSYQSTLNAIQYLLAPDTNETDLSSEYLDIFYPSTASFLDVRREFRDAAHYFIDGDSLLLSLAHRSNVNLQSYHGNTLHIVFLVERFLLTLFHQSHQCNFTLVFFDCHYQLYQTTSSILSLLRVCLIAHLSKNSNQYGTLKIRQFSSWFDENYSEFIREEKPMFMFYHDISTFDFENDPFLSRNVLQKLVCMYRLFGNYHHYILHCQLYLLNKVILTNTTVKCFRIQFHRMCPKTVLKKLLERISSVLSIKTNGEQDCSEVKKLDDEISEDDVRLNLYLQTIAEQQQQQDQLFNPLLILHVALLIRLSISDRHLPSNFPSVTYSSIFSRHITDFQQRLSSKLSTYSSTRSWSKIADLFDGRLFAFTLYQIHQSSTLRLDPMTNEIIKQSFDILKISLNDNIFQDIVKHFIETNDIEFSSEKQAPVTHQQQRSQIIKITNPLIDTYLRPITSRGNELTFDLIDPDESQVIQIRGQHHWQTYKDVGDDIARIPDNDVLRKETTNHRYRTKQLQKLYDYFNLYGRSLSTRDVRDNQLQIVLPTASTPAPTNPENSTTQSASATAASGGKKKQQHKGQSNKAQPSKADVIKEQNSKRILDKCTDEETDKAKNVLVRLKQFANDDYSNAIDFLDESYPSFKTTVKRLELLGKKFDLQRKYLRSLKKKKDNLTIEEKSKVELLQIGFFGTLCEMTHLENEANAFDVKIKFMEELVDASPLERENWYRFQMEKINSRLPRRAQGERDDRVSDFIPDKWQVDFLNAVDQEQSIIIVAPTASGKTYASYYAMGKVLKDERNSRGVCIYVAPTKALINQVAGTILIKFGPVFGIFTQDYRMQLDTCRILVTVPECLEMLLLSPDYQQWCQRIRYCIFDEIHCMSGDIGSDVWERAMLLINCPMIGLSATVNNGPNVRDWIGNVEKQRSDLFNTTVRKVCLISHHERLADLNKYLYSNRHLHPLHPVSLMNAKHLTSRGVPDDFSLSPCETLRLNDAMENTKSTNNQIPTLTDHFSPGWIAERSVCNTYSNFVQNQFKQLIKTNQNSTIDTIASSLNPTTSNQITYPELKPMSSLIGEFVLTLKEKNLLPCIVFTDSRSLCEELAENVTQYFEELEKELRHTKYKHQIEAALRHSTQIDKAQKSNKSKKVGNASNKRGGGGDDDEKKGKTDGGDKPAELQQMAEEDQSQLRLSGYENELLNGILDEGTLANRRSRDQELVDQLVGRISDKNPLLVRYIKRGVAYHHSQLKNRSRLAVEGLFRNRYVQIVFSTWTLALGVHMPTKTVAFVKDSIQLDALQFRQSSGRAGRRGFDVQGNIVFIDIPMSKIRHLTISAIPDIQTHFPTSVTFLMRLLRLYSRAEDKKDALNRSLIALQYPFNAQSSTSHQLIDVQLRFHCLYTLDFLYRLNLINEQGDLIGLAGFSTHLHQHEPANILFAYLLNTQLFHQLNNEEDIVNLLAHIFTHLPWLRKQQSAVTSSIKKSTLRPLSSDIRARIQKYNLLVKQIYGSYIEDVIRHMRSFNNGQEHKLPFSDISFAQTSDYENGTFEYTLHHHYSQQTQNPSISPFVAPSGLTHAQFMSNYNPTIGSWDLAYDLDLSPRLVPLVDIDAYDHTNTSYPLNSYASDFFRHGSERLLISENGLDRSETYNLTADFSRLLISIKTSLSNILENEVKNPANNDISFFKPLKKNIYDIQEDFYRKLHREFEQREL